MATHFSLKKMAVLALLSRGLGTPDFRVFLVKDKTKEKSAVLELYVAIAGVQLPTYQKGIVEDLHGLLALILLPCLVQSYATEVISTPIAGVTLYTAGIIYCQNYILPKLYTAKIIYYQNYILPKLYTARIIYCPGYFYN